ncbi:MAG: molybdopterin molybdotransferase MoeA [Planctomycetota bacterium]|jgi:molybdopterin molybdotransferase
MIAFEEALRIALESVGPGKARRVPLERASGEVLAADVASDTDLPPFDRAAMDGYAVKAADLTEPGGELEVIAEIAAGEEPRVEIRPGQCVRIFTGAVVPQSADTVAIQEITSPGSEERRVRFAEAVKEGANIARRGEDVRAGEVVLHAGRTLGAAEVALAAAAGAGEVSTFPRPLVAVLSTGNELVPPREPIGPGRTRDANGPALVARLKAAGFGATGLGIARDDPAEIRARIAEGLEYDCLIVSGGVSVGEHDFVPEVLGELGVKTCFSKVATKPGKPIKFGLLEGPAGRKVVWGLPGNPVSVLVVTEVMVLPVLRKMAGRSDVEPRKREGRLMRDVKKKPGRRLFAPARLVRGEGEPGVEPLEYHGSADLAAYSRCDVIFTLPANCVAAGAGEPVEYYEREG